MAENNNSGLFGTAGRVLTTLPAQFLALVLINVVFLLGMLWFLEKQQELATKVATEVFDKCISGALTIPGERR